MLWRLRSFPDFCESCLPSPIERPPAGSEWVHEIKHDGFRLLRRRGASGVRLFTRNGNDWTERFPLIVALSALKVATCLFDGEAAPANGCLAGITLLALASNAQAQFGEQKAIDWRTFEVRDFGTSIQYPASIFSPAGQLERGLGKRFERADGRAVLSIYARPNEAGENPKTYLKKNLRVDRSALDYVRIARSFFAISSERDGVILLE
jgi:hypothetical protein